MRAVVLAVALVALASLVHELGHAVAAVAFGAPASTLGFGIASDGPYLALAEPLDGWRSTITGYAGGLPAGAAMVMLYVFWWARRARQEDSAAHWWLGALVLVLAGNELANGLAEGALSGDYLAGKPPTNALGLVGAALGFTAHRVLAGRAPPLPGSRARRSSGR